MSAGTHGGTQSQGLTDKQLRDAMERADMAPRDYRVFGALLFRYDWRKFYIPDPFQPRSIEALATASRMSRAGAAAALAHLERHGWVSRQRQEPGRGKPTRYVLHIGTDCDCAALPEVKAPTPEAERSRRYRARQKASRIRVTVPHEASGIRVTKRPASRDDVAARTSVCAEEGRDEGSRGEGSPKPEYTGGPVPWDDEDVAEWKRVTGQ